MKSRRAEGLPAHRGLDQFHRGPGGSGLKGRRTSAPKYHDQQKDPVLGQPRSRRPGARRGMHVAETVESQENRSEQTYRPLGDRLGLMEPAQMAHKW